MADITKQTITLLGNYQLINEDNLYKYVYKLLKWSVKFKKDINIDFLKEHTKQKEIFFHPLWLAKTLVIASRNPFPPKKIPMMIFLDAISGYRGLISKVPETSTYSVDFPKIVSPRINQPEDVRHYIKDVQLKQINRSYILKKPEHQIIDYNLVFLPIWKVHINSNMYKKTFYINANSGESEEYMSSLWKRKKWLHIS